LDGIPPSRASAYTLFVNRQISSRWNYWGRRRSGGEYFPTVHETFASRFFRENLITGAGVGEKKKKEMIIAPGRGVASQTSVFLLARGGRKAGGLVLWLHSFWGRWGGRGWLCSISE